MTDYEALEIVLDLALEEALEEQEAIMYGVEHEYKEQQEALDKIAALLDRWKKEGTTY